jgi:hypothetical protein
MRRAATGSFVAGLLSGLGFSLLGLLGAAYGPRLVSQAVNHEALWHSLDWVGDNLGLSVIPFALTLGLFLFSLRRLENLLRNNKPLHQVAQADQLTDIWIGLFFGIGVLWTAIGMRSALLFALGDGVNALSGGAADLLDRLVNGGILTALTTTIIGGAGGYLLRLYKTIKVGDRLKQFYGELDQQRSQRIETLLMQINDRLRPAASAQEHNNAL